MTSTRSSKTAPAATVPVPESDDVAELRSRLAEAEETLRAIRAGEVDALVVATPGGDQIYTLQGAETAYRLLVESMSEGAMTLVETGTILYCNRHLAVLLERPLESLISASLRDFVHPGDLPAFDALLRLGKQDSAKGELLLSRPDGSAVPVQLSISALDVEGARGACVIATDLTSQKRSAEIVASELLARSILEQAGDAIVVCDAGGSIIRASATAETLAGGPCVGLPFDSAFPLITATEDGLFDPTGAGCSLRGTEAVLPGGPGAAPRYLLLSAAPLRGAGADVEGCVITMADITARKRAEDALIDADRRKDEFLATLSHELRNPLAPVRNAVRILQMRGPQEPELIWALDLIERQVQQMTRLVDDLLDVARITRDRLELRREPVDLALVIHEAVEISQPLIDARGHALSVLLPDQPIALRADLTRLAQVFSNLLNNAAKYTPPGGAIALTAVREGRAVEVRIRDDGDGIAPDMLPRVFDMFIQVDRSLGRASGGLGIGLTLVKRLVEMHGGSVEARSDGLGAGSEFVVRLPIDPLE